ncbi:MAG: DUF5686 and carboxypeptidase regulatory-like domain-containing protein [bacterium]|nr:DUF5686 and carboxypeptidase regulatory-like domain-containing protein [bacterium]
MKKLYFILFFTLFTEWGISQTYVLSGLISNNKEPLPFATILVEGTSVGVNSNMNGQYTLKLPPGTYKIIYEYIGYSKRTEHVELNSNKVLNVNLKPDGISLKEIDVSAGEDPAYPIIRKAIGKRKYFQDQLPAYTCNAYIKGLQKVKELPKNIKGLIKLFGGELSDTNDIKGVIYLSESESKYHYEKPNEQKEIMYSSKVSGDNRSFSFNKLSDMKLNFYNNLVEMGNLSGRPFVSPLNENAFLFYRYYLQGTITGEGKPIHKIMVVPKRKTDACFAGMIYIQDSTWRITSVDLLLTKEVKIEFVDTLYIKQLYAPILGDSVWMPVTLNFGFDFKAFGFKGSGYFNAHISGYDLNPVFERNFFKNEVLLVMEGSNKKDSTYWNEHRAVPLTAEESVDYRQKDSLVKVRDTDRYKDSVDKVSNRLKVANIFFGYNYKVTKTNFNLSLPGLITNGVQYNTVEGLNLSYYFNMTKKYENYKEYNLGAKVRYGFSNMLWGGELTYNYLFDPIKRSTFGVKVKSIAEQFNRMEPITPLVNSLYTLFLNNNYMKIYKESGVEGFYYSELTNGIYSNTTIRYMQRDPLRNTSDLLLVDDKNKWFSSNDPQHTSTDDSAFTSNRALTAEFQFSFRFKQKYHTLPGQKIITGSKYPRLSVSYKKAFPVMNTSANYDLATATVSDAVKLGLFGRFNYRLRGGGFLSAKKLYFMDYTHFLGNQTIFNTNDYLSSFRLLPYYSFSADKWFTELHAEHHFQGSIIGQIPLVKKLKVQEVIGFHALTSNQLRYYYELNFGLERVFKIIRIDYVLGYAPDSKLKQGFTIGIVNSF